VRRGYVAEKYMPLVDALYSGVDHCQIETQVKFEDGRTGVIRADVKIRDVAVATPAPRRKAA